MSFTWDAEAGAVLAPGARGLIRVLGGPGTGKSSLLVDAAVARIGAGVDPESVLLLTGSGRLGVRQRSALTTALLRPRAAGARRAAVREPLVRTVHGYAYAVLRRAAVRAGDAPPRLVTSAEQDAIVRELLAGDLEDGPAAWPEHLRPALRTAGFATELRNLLARCAERGVDAQQLQRLGRRCRRPEWAAAGRFARQYEQVMLLRAAVGTAAPEATTPALGAAELVGAALEAFAVDPELLAAERARLRVLLVDDAQQLDPQASRLVRVLAAGTELTLVAGDPNQAVYGFRGGDPAGLLGGDTPSVTLTVSHRCAPAVARAVTGIARRLPGGSAGRRIDGTGAEDGAVAVRLAASAHAEAAIIVDALRRAHLVDGVPWSQMAVIVRSVPRVGARLQRALAAAGVPVVVSAVGGPLSEEPAARALLTVLAATADGLDGHRALALLTGPIGRVDPVSLRQLRRTLQRAASGSAARDFGDLVADVLRAGPQLSGPQYRPLRRVRAVLDAAARCHRDGQDPRFTLWAAWHRSGLQRRWVAAAERGGTAGAQATRNLEAVTALFDVTDHYVSRTSGASLPGLLEHVAALQLPGTNPEVSPADRVSVLSAHAALGHEWDQVVIAGLQDGLWPNTIPRGGVLGTQRLLDALDGIAGDASMTAPLLAEERRLLVAAMGRARRRLLVTAVDSDTDGAGDDAALPSSFFHEIAQLAGGAADPVAAQPVSAPRVLSAAALVGRLRGVVCAPDGAVDEADRRCAATQLARLARAGVPGADPKDWRGLLGVSTGEPLRGPGEPVTLTPSTLQTLTDCPLRWLAERHGGTDARDLRSTLGSVLHVLIAEPGKSESQLLAELDRAWQHLPFGARWHSANELARHRGMIRAFVEWRARTRGELSEVGVEVDVDGVLRAPSGEALGGEVRLRGRVDRLERDGAGRLVIVDVKTGKTPVSKDDAQQHAQLAAYQLAVADGIIEAGPAEPGGARLVYIGKAGAAGATEREQDPLTPAARDQWRALVAAAADATAGPRFIARRNDGCAHCPIRPCCPAHDGSAS
ncbi:ATP-dependent DNA helicase [Mycobacterium sp. 663a-19]|uniref:ATP-dependent helicase n=1 Tax=Mycobacterium sp. 663a-19 TaxID=2986148 RepID=UPI002D1E8B5E|nr:ATP-dependent DNA helicase [Mycobacterium sp. 663a-19]MEB3982184.1 ATP-dependent DNA helicase [Mycobacterium sp. 663a-19]